MAVRGVGSMSGPEVYVLGFPWPSVKERQSRDGTCGHLLVVPLCRGLLCGVGSPFPSLCGLRESQLMLLQPVLLARSFP